MEVQLFLVAFIFAAVLTYVQPDIAESADQTVRGNFRDFFDSIKRNDTKNTESYRSFLEHATVQEQKVFDTMKEEFRFMRSKNLYHKRSEKFAQFKRDIGETLVASTSTTILPLADERDTFEEIRTKNKIYVDKTSFIAKLLQSDHRFFRICRPGRFGKSNFLQMLRLLFRGEKKFFEGLSVVRDTVHDWRPYPVIHLDLSRINCRTLGDLKVELSREIIRTGEMYGISIDEQLPVYRDVVPPAYSRDKDVPDNCVLAKDNEGHVKLVDKLPIQTQLGQLVQALTNNGTLSQSVVILIDEYDWPVRQISSNYGLPCAGSPSSSNEFGTFLEAFFYQFVHLQRSIKFLFMTCTTKLCLSARAKIGQKHGLDASTLFRDITMDPEFTEMMGLTESELKSDPFKPHFDAMIVNNPNETFPTLFEHLRKRYNGYNFLPNMGDGKDNDRLYNFYSVVSHLRKKGDHFWHPAVDPKYVLEKDGPRSTLDQMPIHLNRTFTIPRYFVEKSYEHDDVIPMAVSMIQHGYLTLLSYIRKSDEFVVGFPNDEMRESFQKGYMSGERTSLDYFLEETQNLRDTIKVKEKNLQSSDTLDPSALSRLLRKNYERESKFHHPDAAPTVKSWTKSTGSTTKPTTTTVAPEEEVKEFRKLTESEKQKTMKELVASSNVILKKVHDKEHTDYALECAANYTAKIQFLEQTYMTHEYIQTHEEIEFVREILIEEKFELVYLNPNSSFTNLFRKYSEMDTEQRKEERTAFENAIRPMYHESRQFMWELFVKWLLETSFWTEESRTSIRLTELYDAIRETVNDKGFKWQAVVLCVLVDWEDAAQATKTWPRHDGRRAYKNYLQMRRIYEAIMKLRTGRISDDDDAYGNVNEEVASLANYCADILQEILLTQTKLELDCLGDEVSPNSDEVRYSEDAVPDVVHEWNDGKSGKRSKKGKTHKS